MTAVQEMVRQDASLTKALKWCGVTRKRWYYKPKARKTAVDPDMLQMIQQIREERALLRDQKNGRGSVQKAWHAGQPQTCTAHIQENGLGSAGAPQSTKTRWKHVKATRPNQIWETDITYIWCGPADGWCYCLNVLDIFTRQWIAYRLSTLATTDVARVTSGCCLCRQAGLPDAYPPVRQRSQYASKKFRKSMSLLGTSLAFIRTHTPEQNGHIESFHGTLKLEYIWPHDFANYQEAEAVIAAAFRDYNQARPHSALKYVPPDEFMATWDAEHK